MITESQSTRPGRPKSQEKRDAIREAAMTLFMTEGLQRTSMDAIAAAAGVSKQTVYSHFENKDALFRECVSEKTADYGLRAGEIPDDLPLEDALIAFGKKFLELIQDPEVLSATRLVIGESSVYPSIAGVFHSAGPEQTRRSLASLLQRFAARGQIRLEDPMEAASLLISLVDGPYFLQLLLGVRDRIDPGELETHLRRNVRRFIALHAPR